MKVPVNMLSSARRGLLSSASAAVQRLRARLALLLDSLPWSLAGARLACFQGAARSSLPGATAGQFWPPDSDPNSPGAARCNMQLPYRLVTTARSRPSRPFSKPA